MTRGFVKKRHVGEFLGSWEVRLYQGHVALVLPAVHTPHAYTPLYTMESLSTDTRHLPAFRPTTNNISMNISMHTRDREKHQATRTSTGIHQHEDQHDGSSGE